MNPRFLHLSGVVALALLSPLPARAADRPVRPNILFIMADDHAAHAISAYGSRINRTPNIDRLAKEGMRFNHCFAVNSICTPSRAAILTGKYSHINGVPVFNRFDGSQPTVAKMLHRAGYQTAMIGKWHLGSDPTGFDYWNILPGQGRYHDPEFIEMGDKKVVKGYVSDIIADLSIAFLEKRDPTKPFLLFCHHKAPHRNWSPDVKHAHMYDGVDIPEPVTFNDDYAGRSHAATEATMRIDRDLNRSDVKGDPPPGLSPEGRKRWNYQRYIKDYLRCVASVDDNVGRLLEYLDKHGLRENTIVIYTSDQGFFLGDHNWFDKRFMYEESLRMPFLIRYPGQIQAGSVNDAMILNVDFAPTFLDYAGMTIPEDIQGRSIRPLLRGRKPDDWRTSMYYRYYHYPQDHRVQPHYGVRSERYKLIYFNKIDEWELYDLQADPYETNNVYAASDYAELVRTMKAELARLKKEVKDEDQFANGLFDPRKLRQVSQELVLRYDFAAMDGDLVKDQTGRHDARVQDGTAVPGHSGKALKFDGKGQLVPLAPTALNPANKPLIAGAWCKPESPDGMVISLGGGGRGFALYLQDARPCFSVRVGGELFTAKGAQQIALNEWVHLSGRVRATGGIEVLVNGEPASTAAAAPVDEKPHEGLTIGADPGSHVGNYETAMPWRGCIEDVRIYWGEVPPATLAQWRGN